MTDPEVTAYSLGDLRIAAERAVAAGEATVVVDAKALLKLCESEAWAHDLMTKAMTEIDKGHGAEAFNLLYDPRPCFPAKSPGDPSKSPA